MLPKSVVLLAVLASSLAGIVSKKNIEAFAQGNGRIVGGTTATLGQIPYQALFHIATATGFNLCGCSIVSDRWVITAGHCAYENTADIVVVIVGTIQLYSGGTTMEVKKLELHPNFDINLGINDIAMAKTMKSIEFTPTVQPIGIGSGAVIPGNVVATVSGWGLTSFQGVASDTLQFLNVVTLFTDDCRLNVLNPSVVYANTICALGAVGYGPCNGDSGGPLVANGQLIGVVSSSFTCANGTPDVYVRISSHYDWIMKKLDS